MADHSIPRITAGTAQIVEALIGSINIGSGYTPLPFMVHKVALTAEATPANGGMFNWQNPWPVRVMATVLLDVTTPATGAANADVGKAANATTSADTLLDGVDVGTAAILANPVDNQGTNGVAFQDIDENGGTNDFITGTASADSSGLVGNAYVLCIPVN